jgi:hypothetical protein
MDPYRPLSQRLTHLRTWIPGWAAVLLHATFSGHEPSVSWVSRVRAVTSPEEHD